MTGLSLSHVGLETATEAAVIRGLPSEAEPDHWRGCSSPLGLSSLCCFAGKAHLKKAIMKHEEAMRIHGLCKILRKMDILQEVLSFAHKRSLSKYSEIDHEEDFFETGDAPDIHRKCFVWGGGQLGRGFVAGCMGQADSTRDLWCPAVDQSSLSAASQVAAGALG